MSRDPSAPGSAGGYTWCDAPVPRQNRGLRVKIAIIACLFILPACTSRPVGESTRMTISDIDAMTEQMAQSLLGSDALASRGPDSPPWIVSIDKVLNLSDEVMTENEQWSIMAQVRGAAPIQALWDQKAVRFVIPAQRALALKQSANNPDFHQGFGTDRHVTHTMTATFRSITRAQAKKRSDLYYCQFDLIDLKTGETVWSDRFEFKRQARGQVWD